MEIGKDRSADLKRVFRINKTIMQMMVDRGYFVFADQREMKFEDFEAKFPDAVSARQQLSIPYLKKEEDQVEQKLYVFFAETPNKFTKDDLKIKVKAMQQNLATKGLVILQGESSVNTADVEKGYQLEFFKEEELLVNITEHELVPKHVLINAQEKEELLHRYKLKEQQLPKILVTDPVARYYGLIVKIIRESETAGKYVTYRYVS